MNAQQLADQIRTALGPEWWAAKVAVATQEASWGLLVSLIVLAFVIAVGIGGAIFLARSHEDTFDKTMGFLVGGFFWLVVVAFIAAMSITFQSTITSPDLHVWQELVTEVSAVLQ